jgi:hypothetical protein
MTYHIGIGASLAAAFGRTAQEPHITCDGCGLVRSVFRARGVGAPAAWFLDGKAPPGWRLINCKDGRSDYCPRCKEGK